MAGFSIFFRKSVQKDLTGIPKKDVRKILEHIKGLENDPRPPGCEKLTGQKLAGQLRYRLRQGKYRIVYSIQDNELTVWIVTIGHRREIYR